MKRKAHRCGECDSKMIAVGQWWFCTKPACSMWDRAVDQAEIDDNEDFAQRTLAAAHRSAECLDGAS